MDTEQKLTDWELKTERKPDEDQNDTFTVLFYELLSEQRY